MNEVDQVLRNVGARMRALPDDEFLKDCLKDAGIDFERQANVA